MDGALVTRLAWWWERLRAALGPAGMAGCALLVAIAVLYVTAVMPQRSTRDALIAEAQELHSRYRMPGAALAGGRIGIADQLRTFYGFFPALESTPEWLARIFAAAEREGLTLPSGEYRDSREREARLIRYQITLPVKGSYLQIQRFIAAVLAEVPALSLDDISLKREHIGEQSLEARLRFTLFLGNSE